MSTRLYVGVALALAGAVAIGASGCGEKSPTGPTCTISLNPSSLTVESSGGAGSIAVNAPSGCAWTAASSEAWISITNGSSGNGSGNVNYTVAANPSTDSRVGAITVGTQRHEVTQKGKSEQACAYDLSPGSADYSKDGGSGTFAVTAPDGCAWAAASNASWLTLTTASGQGPGSVGYTVARQTAADSRTAAITVADKTFSVRQSGDIGICTYSVSPVDFTPCMPGGTVTTTITTQTSCPWTADVSVPWLRVSAAAGSGAGALSITFTENYDAPRQGIVMIRWPTPTAGQNVRVNQAGCRYAVSRSSFGFVATGGTGTFDVLQESDPNTCGGATQDRCIWSAQSNVSWIVVTTPMPRSGDNPVSFTVAANDSTSPRVGTITVRDQVVTITQSGR
jgi:hypothetical protein